MSSTVEIYVYLEDENIDVWRPVLAEHIAENTYRILEQSYNRSDEHWRFEPGDKVVCKMTKLSEGEFLVAVENASG